jgi:hypothetical protein
MAFDGHRVPPVKPDTTATSMTQAQAQAIGIKRADQVHPNGHEIRGHGYPSREFS